MTRNRPALPGLCIILVCVLFCAIQTGAQLPTATPRITQPVDDSNLVVLRGNTHPLALPQYDQGAAPASLPMHRMLLVLQRSPQQEAALDQLLEQQQDNSSANYHHWLTPQQFGATFGPAAADIQTITAWLQSRGFQVTRVARGGILIEFSGTAGQVQDAFHTSIHEYMVNSQQQYANSSDPQIPAALVPVVAGVRSLNNFPVHAMNRPAGIFHRDKDSGKILPVGPLPIPQFNGGVGCGILGGPCEFLGPFDLATIYNYAPLWNATTPIDGTGQTIAIVGDSDINPADWVAFWSMFGVTTPKGTLNIIHDGPAPGIQGDEAEADIDTQWSSAVAKGATIDFVVSQGTETTFGVDLSAEYIVDNNLAPVMSESFGLCELFVGTSGNAFYNALWQQASAQGITVLISSGDQGSAGCDRGAADATFGLAVSGFESTPFNVSVGGTDFNDLTTSASFWNPTNNPNQANAKGYIPEMTWNDSCTNSEIFIFAGTTTAEQTCQIEQGFVDVTGGSGGMSNCTSSTGQVQSSCTGGYAKPSWQTGPGVPADGKRDVPDVSLFASNGFNGTGYIVCQSDQTNNVCNLASEEFLGFGGTSVSSPAFAGIMALINQKTGERQGNANYVFYKMAAAAGNSCNSSTVSSTGTNNCVFYDIPTDFTIAMPCAAGSPNCTVSTPVDQIGVLSGFSTTSGYDLATGLGSVNVNNLVTQWSTFAGQFKATKFSSFTLGPPVTITHGQSIPVAATVVPQTGTGTPTGSVVLIANTGSSLSDQQAAQQLLPLTNGSLAPTATTSFLPGGTSYTVTAHYSGDPTFAPSDSAPVTVTVNPEASKTQAEIVTFNPTTGAVTSSNATTLPYGSFYFLRANVTNSSASPCAPNGNQVYGCPTGTVTLTDTYNGATNPLDGGTFPLNAEGYAEDQPIFLLGGQHTIAASYGGDKSYTASTASPDVVTVTKAPTTIILAANGGSIQEGAGVVVTVTVNSQTVLPPNPPAADFPSDNVQFFVGSKPLTLSPTASVTYTPGLAGGTGFAQLTAVLNTTSLPLGSNTITAQFTGDASYSASAVSNAVVIDNQDPTFVTLSSSNSTIQHGANVTFTAVITPIQTGGPALTGTVQFAQNGTNFGSAVTLVNGQAQLSTSTLPGGVLSITAAYSGDVNYGTSGGNLQEIVSLLATTTTVTTSNPAIVQGASVTLTAHVAPNAAGGSALSGTVQFLSAISAQSSDNPLGPPVSVANGQAQLTTSSIAAGTNLILAAYSGDANYANSTGSTAEVVSSPPTFTVVGNPTSITITSPGGSGSAMLTFTAENAYSGTIPLSPSLCSGMPSETTCTFNVSSVALTSTITTATATVTFQTTARSNSTALPQSSNRPIASGRRMPTGSFALAFVVCMAILFTCFAPRRRRLRTILALLAIASAVAIGSCGGGSSSTTGPPGGGNVNPGTTVGVDQSVAITFSGAGVTPPPTVGFTITVQ
jgi:hypothetical protein